MRADLSQLRDRLAELESYLAQAGAVSDLPTGLAPDQARRLAEESGLRLTDELVEFFSWHDGFGAFPTPMHNGPHSFTHSLKMTRTMKEQFALETACELGMRIEEVWAPHWYAFGNVWGFMGGPVFDLSVVSEDPTPVLSLEIGDLRTSDYATKAFDSLSDLVAAWNCHLKIGFDTWDPQEGIWQRNETNIHSPFTGTGAWMILA